MKSILLYISIFLLVFVTHAQQPGCTDPNAQNYNPAATDNDGSCTYGTTKYAPVLITDLSEIVSETSDLLYWNNTLWTNNDSGGNPELYAIDTSTGAVIRKVWIRNATNVDWEDITRDADYMYIGDIGNNDGTRTDLKIYKVSLGDMAKDTADAEVITYSYPDQTDFSSRPQDQNFDAEAIIAFGDSLYIFSKNWANLRTKVYVLPKSPGNYSARLADEMFAGGLITSADFNFEDSVICLTAYTKLLQPFSWFLWDFPGNSLLKGNKRKILFNTLSLYQVEGICHVNGSEYFISNERLGNIPAQLHRVQTNAWIAPLPLGVHTPSSNVGELKVFPNPTGKTATISWDKSLIKAQRLDIYDVAGNKTFSVVIQAGTDTLQMTVGNMTSGIYKVVLIAAEGNLVESLVILSEK